MDFRQLTALIAVADHSSFSAAARALATVQSNVSTHIARLEKELGATLFDRAEARLTDEGELVVARARQIQKEMDSLVADVASMGDVITGTVTAGIIGSTARWIVPTFLDRMAEVHPMVRVQLVDASTTSLTPQLLSGRLDLALMALPVGDADVVEMPLFCEDRILVVPPDHPLHGAEEVTLAEAAEHELLLLPKGTPFRDQLDAAFAKAKLTLKPKAEVDGIRLVASLAFEGYCAAILPASAAPESVKGRWARVRVPDLPQRTVGIGQRRRGIPTASARAFTEVMATVVAETGPEQPGIYPVATETLPKANKRS